MVELAFISEARDGICTPLLHRYLFPIGQRLSHLQGDGSRKRAESEDNRSEARRGTYVHLCNDLQEARIPGLEEPSLYTLADWEGWGGRRHHSHTNELDANSNDAILRHRWQLIGLPTPRSTRSSI